MVKEEEFNGKETRTKKQIKEMVKNTKGGSRRDRRERKRGDKKEQKAPTGPKMSEKATGRNERETEQKSG